jgi:hypothetical protein
MRFSDNCLLLITTVLENEGYCATDTEVADALTEMFEGKKRPPTKTPGKYDLQPGEVYVIRDSEDPAYIEDCDTREKLNKALENYAQECADNRQDLDDRVEVFIKRCDVPVRMESKITVALG